MTHPSANLTLQAETSLHVTRHPPRQSTLQALARLQFTAQSSPHESAQREVSWHVNAQWSTHWPPHLDVREQSTLQPGSRQMKSQESKSRHTQVPAVQPSQ
jgi:hypothetical protein